MKTLFVTLMTLLIIPQAIASSGIKKFIREKIPIHITARSFTALNNKGVYIFKGNVIAKRGNVTLKSNKMEIYKNKKSGEIKEIICTGNVIITQKNKEAKAHKAIYNYPTGRITLIGNASVKSNKNLIRAYEIVYYLNSGYAVANSSNKHPVSVTLYPNKNLTPGGNKK